MVVLVVVLGVLSAALAWAVGRGVASEHLRKREAEECRIATRRFRAQRDRWAGRAEKAEGELADLKARVAALMEEGT